MQIIFFNNNFIEVLNKITKLSVMPNYNNENEDNIIPPNGAKYDSIDDKEPIFQNLPQGTIALLAIMILVQLLRIGETDLRNTAAWVDSSSLVAIRLKDFFQNGIGGFGALWPLIGYQFLHGGFFHLTMNSAMLLQVGPISEIGFIPGANLINYKTIPENAFGRRVKLQAAIWFILFFLSCGIFGGLGFYFLNPDSNIMLMGASGSISGVFAGYLWSAFIMAPRGHLVLKPLISSAMVFLFINVGLAAFARSIDAIPIAWESHLFGFIGGLIFYPIFYRLSRITI